MLTDSNSKCRKYQYYVGGTSDCYQHIARQGHRSRAGSKENFQRVQTGCHIYTMPECNRIPTEPRQSEEEASME